jgi:hypothetical protein
VLSSGLYDGHVGWQRASISIIDWQYCWLLWLSHLGQLFVYDFIWAFSTAYWRVCVYDMVGMIPAVDLTPALKYLGLAWHDLA